MASLPPIEQAATMIGRIRAILLEPRAEWARIEAEPATIRSIMIAWVAPLAAIGPVAKLIASQLFGISRYGGHIRPPLVSSATEALVSYAASLAGVYLLALAIAGLAPRFGARNDRVQAFKLAAYGATAAYLAGIFELAPRFEWLGAVGIYSLVLIALGLPVLMRVPREKVLVYSVVSILSAIGLAIAFAVLVSIIGDAATPELPASAYDYTPPGG